MKKENYNINFSDLLSHDNNNIANEENKHSKDYENIIVNLKNQVFQLQGNNYNRDIIDYQNYINDLKMEIEDQEHLKNQIKFLKSKNIELQDEIEKVRKIKILLENQLNQFKNFEGNEEFLYKKYNILLNEYKILEQDNKKVNNQNNDLRREIRHYKTQLENINPIINQTDENKILKVNYEIKQNYEVINKLERANFDLLETNKNYKNDFDDIKKYNEKLEIENIAFKQEIFEIKEKLKLKEIYNIDNKEILNYKKIVKKLENKIELLESENDTFKQNKNIKFEENDIINNKNIIKNLKNQNEILELENKNLEKLKIENNNYLEEYKIELKKKNNQYKNLYLKNSEIDKNDELIISNQLTTKINNKQEIINKLNFEKKEFKNFIYTLLAKNILLELENKRLLIKVKKINKNKNKVKKIFN